MNNGNLCEKLKKQLYYSLLIWVICTIVCFVFKEYLTVVIKWPYNHAMGTDVAFRSVGPIRELLSYIQISVVLGLILSSPLIFYSLWKYLFVRVCNGEIHFNKFWAIFSGASFGVGALFFLFIIAPIYFNNIVRVEMKILKGYTNANVEFGNYVSFIIGWMLFTGILFHSPILLAFLKSKKQKTISNQHTVQ